MQWKEKIIRLIFESLLQHSLHLVPDLSHHILSLFIKINVNVKYLNQRKKEIKKIIANLKVVYIKKQVEQERKDKNIHDNASQ